VICHGAWTLVEAEVVRGRTLTSFPTLATDIRNAGGTWVDRVFVSPGVAAGMTGGPAGSMAWAAGPPALFPG